MLNVMLVKLWGRLFCSLFLLVPSLGFTIGEPATELQKVQINIDSAEQISSLKGIGTQKAELIVQYRELYGPFHTVEELMQIRGIGPKLIEKNRGRLGVELPVELGNKPPKK